MILVDSEFTFSSFTDEMIMSSPTEIPHTLRTTIHSSKKPLIYLGLCVLSLSIETEIKCVENRTKIKRQALTKGEVD